MGLNILFAFLTWMFVVVGLMIKPTHKYQLSLLSLLSFSSGLIALTLEHLQVKQWVLSNDMSALLDVVPTMNNAYILFIVVTIVLNILLFIKQKKIED